MSHNNSMYKDTCQDIDMLSKEEALSKLEELTQESSTEPKVVTGTKGKPIRDHIMDYIKSKNYTYVSTPNDVDYVIYDKDETKRSCHLYDSKLLKDLVGSIAAIKNKIVTKEEVSTVLYAVHAQERIELDYEPENRVARDNEGSIWIDLGLPSWDMVKVTPEGWEILPYTGEPFMIRHKKSLPLPIPERGGSLKLFKPFVNGSYDEFIKVCGFMIASLKPDSSFPPLVLSGSHRSGKSTLASYIVRLIDNRKSRTMRMPKMDDIITTATKNYVLSFDNISSIDRNTSDFLCRLVTGEAVSKRKLYSDNEEVEYIAARPCILNGIGNLVDKGDLTDRAIFVNLDPVAQATKKGDHELQELWEKDSPKIFGGLLDALVSSMKNWKHVSLKEDVRFVDTTRWVEAATIDLKEPLWNPGDYERLIHSSSQANNEDILENDPLAYWIMHELKASRVIEGTAQDIITRLLNFQQSSETKKMCPHTPKLLYKKLEELKPILIEQGIYIERAYTRVSPQLGKKQERRIKIIAGKEKIDYLRVANNKSNFSSSY